MKVYAVLALCSGAVFSGSCKKENSSSVQDYPVATSHIVVANNRPGEFYRFSSDDVTKPTGTDSTETIYRMLFADPTGRSEAVLEIMAGTIVTSKPGDFHATRFAQKLWAVFAPGNHMLDHAIGSVNGFKIVYVDPQGHQWYSDLAPQGAEAIFCVFDTQMHRYTSQLSVSAKVSFSCDLYDHRGNSIRLVTTALPLAAEYHF